MSMARLVITAVTIEGRSKSEVARDYGVSRVWVQKLLHRFDAEGEAAFEPRSRRPHASPQAVDADTEDAIIRLRKELSKQGLDAGAETILTHLARQAPPSGGRPAIPAVSTIWRILSRRGFVRPQPQKRPRSSWKSFCAEQPNERWQADITHWQLADGSEISILNIVDDHSRACLGSHARRNTTGSDVVASFRKAFTRWGIPAKVLSDNGAVFTAKQRGEGRVALEAELGVLGVRFDHSRPYHPQTCGKVERFHQTQKKWLAAQPPCDHDPGVATPAGPVRRLLQHHPAAPGDRSAHPRPGLRGPAQSDPHRHQDPRPLPGPQRHHRLRRHRHPAAQQPTPPHRPRRRPPRNPRHPTHRRPPPARHRPRHRPADPRTH